MFSRTVVGLPGKLQSDSVHELWIQLVFFGAWVIDVLLAVIAIAVAIWDQIEVLASLPSYYSHLLLAFLLASIRYGGIGLSGPNGG